MGLIKLFPRSIRMALYYVKSKKVSVNKSISREAKIEAVHKLEKKWIGNVFEVLRGTKEQDVAIAIGVKDMAKIFVKLDAPDDALNYLNSVEDIFPVLLDIKNNNSSVFEAYIFSLFLRGNAYALKGLIDECYNQFDLVNVKLNEQMASEPSNSRLQSMNNYLTEQMFDVYLILADKFPEKRQPAYRACLNQLKVFLERDPGNDIIQDLIDRFK